jgi:hypothetical protein
MNDHYPYLANLTKTEFNAVTSIMRKYGAKGFLSIMVEIAQVCAVSNTGPPERKPLAKQVAVELPILIARLEDFAETQTQAE